MEVNIGPDTVEHDAVDNQQTQHETLANTAFCLFFQKIIYLLLKNYEGFMFTNHQDTCIIIPINQT